MVLDFPNFLPRVFNLITCPDKKVRKEVCWIISNITAGSTDQINLILHNSSYMDALKNALIQDIKEVFYPIYYIFID